MDEHKSEKLTRDTLRMRPVGGERSANPGQRQTPENAEYRYGQVRREAMQPRYGDNPNRQSINSNERYSSSARSYPKKQKMETPYIVILAVIITLIAVLSVVLLVIRSSSPELEAEPGIEAPFIQETDIPTVTPDDITDEEIIEDVEEVIEEEPEEVEEEPVEESEEVVEEENTEDIESTQTPDVSTEPENIPDTPATEPPADTAPVTPEVPSTPEPAPSPESAPPVTEPATEPPAQVQEQPAAGNDSGLADLVR